MAIAIDDPELEDAIEEVAKVQPGNTSKRAITVAILKRAVASGPKACDRWLREEPEPAIDRPPQPAKSDATPDK